MVEEAVQTGPGEARAFMGLNHAIENRYIPWSYALEFFRAMGKNSHQILSLFLQNRAMARSVLPYAPQDDDESNVDAMGGATTEGFDSRKVRRHCAVSAMRHIPGVVYNLTMHASTGITTRSQSREGACSSEKHLHS